jgi:hypothetical protein
LFNPVAFALDDALDDFRDILSKPENAVDTDLATRQPLLELPFVAPVLHDLDAAAGIAFSEKDIMRGLILVALRDASGHSRRISTLYCASSLCFFVASMMNDTSDSECAPSRDLLDDDAASHPSCAARSEGETSNVETSDAGFNAKTMDSFDVTDQQGSNRHTDSKELAVVANAKQEEGDEASNAIPSDGVFNADGDNGSSGIASPDQEEKKEAHDEISSPKGSPSFFSRFRKKSKKADAKESKTVDKEKAVDIGSGIAAAAAAAALQREKMPPESASVEEPSSEPRKELNIDVAEESQDKRHRHESSNQSTEGQVEQSALLPPAETTGSANSRDDVDLGSEDNAHTGEITPSLDPTQLVDVSRRALLRGLTIANQASSQGMIGWLEYGSSNFLDRTAGRPLDILGMLAYQQASRQKWQVSIDILRTLVLRCEQHLPLYHPVTLSSMLDLAATCLSASKRTLGLHVVVQVSERLSFYLTEQESAYVEFHDALQSGSNEGDVSFQPLTGADHLSMLRSFTALFEELLDRDYLQLFGDDNDILLINRCLVGDSFAVLANCLQLSETGRKPLYRSSDSYWSAACRQYRLAFEAWTRKGYDLSHPNVSTSACSMARCLRELGEVEKAARILTSVVGAAGQASPNEEAMGPSLELSKHEDPSTSFLPPRAPSDCRKDDGITAEEAAALRLWYMAAYAVESNPDERGRIRALSLLHASSESLQRALKEAPSFGEDSSSASRLEMLECVEDEARDIFAPLDAIQEEEPTILLERPDNKREENEPLQNQPTEREPYPSRTRMHHTGTKASILPSAFA